MFHQLRPYPPLLHWFIRLLTAFKKGMLTFAQYIHGRNPCLTNNCTAQIEMERSLSDAGKGSRIHFSTKSLFWLSAFSGLILLTTGGCTQSDPENPVIASVGTEQLTLNEAMKSVPEDLLERDPAAMITRYRDQWLRTKVHTAHASELQLDQTEHFQMRIQQIRDQYLQDMLRETILAGHYSELEVSDQEAQQYFQTHREEFLMNERFVRFRHITTNTRAEAEEANRELMSGTDWEVIADTYSIHPEQQKQFAEKFWPESMVLQEYPDLRYFLSYIGITERSPIVYLDGHYHMIQLMEEKKEEEYPELEWLLPRIKEWLKIEKSQRIVNAYLRNLYLQAESNNEIYSVSVTELDEMLKYHNLSD